MTTSSLLAIWHAIEPGRENSFEQWHSHIHLTQKKESNLLVSGARYRSDTDSHPRWFTLYESRDSAAFGPSGYQGVSPTLDHDVAVRSTFVDFVRGVFTVSPSNLDTTGWITTIAVKSADEPAPGIADLAGHDGVVAVRWAAYDVATTTSFTLRHEPRPALPDFATLVLLHSISRPAAVAAARSIGAVAEVSRVEHFALQQEFRL